jgi:hypothetical protein
MSFMAQKKAWFSNFDNGALHLLVAQHTIAGKAIVLPIVNHALQTRMG